MLTPSVAKMESNQSQYRFTQNNNRKCRKHTKHNRKYRKPPNKRRRPMVFFTDVANINGGLEDIMEISIVVI
jgi:hypothetical protein